MSHDVGCVLVVLHGRAMAVLRSRVCTMMLKQYVSHPLANPPFDSTAQPCLLWHPPPAERWKSDMNLQYTTDSRPTNQPYSNNLGESPPTKKKTREREGPFPQETSRGRHKTGGPFPRCVARETSCNSPLRLRRDTVKQPKVRFWLAQRKKSWPGHYLGRVTCQPLM